MDILLCVQESSVLFKTSTKNCFHRNVWNKIMRNVKALERPHGCMHPTAPSLSVVPLRDKWWRKFCRVSRPLSYPPTFASLRGSLPVTSPALGCSKQILDARKAGLLPASYIWSIHWAYWLERKSSLSICQAGIWLFLSFHILVQRANS